MKVCIHTCLNVVQPECYSGWEGWLRGPCGDGQSLGDQLALAGFQSRTLYNDAATVRAYDEAIRQLADETADGDTVLLHHSHHGGRRDNGIFGGFQETFCLSDGELLDADWARLLTRFKSGVNVIAVLDCCHSGGMNRGTGRPKARPAFLTPSLHRAAARAPSALNCNLIILPACRAEETCAEQMIPEISEVRGLWTWAIVRELQQRRDIQARTLLPDLYEGARNHCAEHFPNQHPRVVRLGPNPEHAWQTRIP